LRIETEERNEEVSQLRDLSRSIEENQQGRSKQTNEQLEQQEKLAYDLAVERQSKTIK